MFSQVEGALERSQGGLGIGLALVKGLVELHGGTVEASSDGPGRGSTFTIRLPPACVSGEFTNAVPAQSLSEPFAGPPGAGGLVLVADDNRESAEALTMLQPMARYQVHEAHTGSDPLEIANTTQPDACILDIGMPGLSGYELARAVREQPWGRRTLLIAVTGWGQQKDVARARASGFDLHFTKPVDVAEIERALSGHFRAAAASRQ
jgi:CheY-like chemotaxis protein